MRTLKLLFVVFGMSLICIPSHVWGYISMTPDMGPVSQNQGLYGFTYSALTYGAPQNGEFKIFIPPGVKSVGIQVTIPNDSSQYAAIRYKIPPIFGTPVYSYEVYPSLSFLESDTRYRFNEGGFITIANDTISQTSASNCGWVYVKLSGTDIYNIRCTLSFDKTIYGNWYKAGQWDTITQSCSSGTTDPCAGVSCGYGQTCQNGTCVCTSTNCTGNYQCQGNQCVQVYSCGANQYCQATNSTSTCIGTPCVSYTSCSSTATSCSSGSLIYLNNNTSTRACQSGAICYPSTNNICTWASGAGTSGTYCPNNISSTNCSTTACNPYTICASGQTCSGGTITVNGMTGCIGTCNSSSTSCDVIRNWQCAADGFICSNGNCVSPTYNDIWIPVGSTTAGTIRQQTLDITQAPTGLPYIILEPKLQFPTALTGDYEFYALLVDNSGGVYVATKDRLTNIVFIQHTSRDQWIRSYDKRTIQNQSSWQFVDVFNDLLNELHLTPTGCKNNNYRFYVGIAPANVNIAENYSSLHAVEFYCK